MLKKAMILRIFIAHTKQIDYTYWYILDSLTKTGFYNHTKHLQPMIYVDDLCAFPISANRRLEWDEGEEELLLIHYNK